MRIEIAKAALAALLLVSGCTRVIDAHPQAEPLTASPPAAASPPAPPAPPPDPLAALEPSFAELAEAASATIGLAVAPVGSAQIRSFGSWSTGVAWSTIKVPLAIAALRVAGADVQPLVVRAITQSDNGAAEQLWSQLGPPDAAAQQVQSVLRETGDDSTAVESHRLRPGFTAFGQTRWSLELQARFAAGLPCIAGADGVVELMRDVGGGQRWGLAGGDTPVKGGWGPDGDGRYLVRQLAVLSTPAGQVGVAMAAEPHDGTFGTGIAVLDRMADWVSTHAADLPGGKCG